MSLRDDDSEGVRQMQRIGKGVRMVLGGALFALTVYLILALPGVVSDRSSTVPNQHVGESRR